MGLLRENALAIDKNRKEREALAEAAAKEIKKERQMEAEKRYVIKEAEEKKINEFAEYKQNVKKVIVTEALKRIYMGSMVNPSSSEKSIGEALIGNYINEKGVDTIIESFHRSNTAFLDSLYESCNMYYESETENADKDDPSTMVINRKNAGEILDKTFDSDDIDDITNTIRLRVSGAEEEFVNKNQMDKANIESILADTQKRIADAKMDNDNDYAEVISNEASSIARDKIYKIRHEGFRNVFHQMVLNLSEAALKNPELRDQYSADAGRLDMDKIVESVRCMYTMLEMVSTLKMENVDAQYIKETIESIK